MQPREIQTVGLIAGCANLELELEKFSHVMSNMRNEMCKVIARLLSKHAELTDVSRQPVNTMHYDLKLLPVF